MSKENRNHAKDVTHLLKAWLLSDQHKDDPYPTEQEKLELMEATGLNRKQLCNWFVNARKRILQPTLGRVIKRKRSKGDAEENNLPTKAASQTEASQKDERDNNSSTPDLPVSQSHTDRVSPSSSMTSFVEAESSIKNCDRTRVVQPKAQFVDHHEQLMQKSHAALNHNNVLQLVGSQITDHTGPIRKYGSTSHTYSESASLFQQKQFSLKQSCSKQNHRQQQPEFHAAVFSPEMLLLLQNKYNNDPGLPPCPGLA
jgi:hypothetical protein